MFQLVEFTITLGMSPAARQPAMRTVWPTLVRVNAGVSLVQKRGRESSVVGNADRADDEGAHGCRESRPLA